MSNRQREVSQREGGRERVGGVTERERKKERERERERYGVGRSG